MFGFFCFLFHCGGALEHLESSGTKIMTGDLSYACYVNEKQRNKLMIF